MTTKTTTAAETLARAKAMSERYHLAYAELRVAVTDAIAEGNTERDVAAATGLARGTVRRWQGK